MQTTVNASNKISTTDLDVIKANLTEYFANLGKGYFAEFRFGVKFCSDKLSMYKELLMYQWVLTYWNQYEDGTPIENNNVITLEEFNVIVERIKFLIT